MASRAQRNFGIFVVRLQMAINKNVCVVKIQEWVFDEGRI